MRVCAPQTHTDLPTARPLQYSATDWTAETERGGVGRALGDIALRLLQSKGNPAPTSHGCLIRFDSSRKQANHLAGTNTQDIRGRRNCLALCLCLSLFFSFCLSLFLWCSFSFACSFKLIIIISYYNTSTFIIKNQQFIEEMN